MAPRQSSNPGPNQTVSSPESSASAYSVVSRIPPVALQQQTPKTLTDLPAELLSEVASYLDRKDLKSLLRTRKSISQAVSNELYHSIDWSFGALYPYYLLRDIDMDRSQRTSQTSGHALASVLSDHPDRAQYVRHLCLHWEICFSCHPEVRHVQTSLIQTSLTHPPRYSPGCDLAPGGLLQHFTNVKSLHLRGHWDKMAAGQEIVSLPRLETLTLERESWLTFHQPVGAVSIEQVLRQMMHPRLRALTLQGVMVRWFGRQELSNTFTTTSSLLSLVSLTLDGSLFGLRSLPKLLGQLPALRSLGIKRQREYIYRIDGKMSHHTDSDSWARHWTI